MTKQAQTPEKIAETKPSDPTPKITKKALVEQLLKSDKGATIEEIAKKTSWQHHTIRGHLSILKKAGTNITSERVDGARYYHITEKTA